jgi:predicted AAA+ superfamily ATPase
MHQYAVMILRKLDIATALSRFPVVALLGARQVGKTTLAKQAAATLEAAGRATLYLDLERPSDLARLQDAELFLQAQTDKLVVIDEVQRRPDLFPLLRALVDADRGPGRFLILGSAAPELLRQSSESLAGRITYLELGPFTLDEVGATPENQRRLWLRGGFPDSFLATDDDASLAWREAFIRTYLERDLPQLGFRLAATELRRFWQMLAHHHGQLWNGSQLAGSLGVNHTTVRRWLDVLEATYMARVLPPLHANLKKRLTKSPKVYLRDSGLLHALLGIRGQGDLFAHPVAGASWEGFALEQILAERPGGNATFYRTTVGAEIDLVLEQGARRQAWEFKLGLAPKPARGFWQGLEDLEIAEATIVYPGDAAYPLKESVWVRPLAECVSAN